MENSGMTVRLQGVVDVDALLLEQQLDDLRAPFRRGHETPNSQLELLARLI